MGNKGKRGDDVQDAWLGCASARDIRVAFCVCLCAHLFFFFLFSFSRIKRSLPRLPCVDSVTKIFSREMELGLPWAKLDGWMNGLMFR